ncbi:hypothetical protein [Autumnicola musiva]|uniref:DUF4258 domain-containing protein n=1 Tax=Autumnicola musiva TaxID=3075589 RepID=A0ABU3D6T5_9FLAO|nr:hypothetical protein [Zunongwangia sp. F117]MDT0677228.1 hypothetical protein [Zunongwangia sp. F117]
MKLIHRLGFYGFGLILGIIILMFFLGGKRTSCDYSPNARVLKNIRIKERSFSEDALIFFRTSDLDTAVVSNILENGNVDFGKSETQKDPCHIYYITGESSKLEQLELQIENCDSTATIMNAHHREE